MKTVSKLFFIALFFLLLVCVYAQTQPVVHATVDTVATDSLETKKTYVYMEHADSVSFNKKMSGDVRILKGNVCFRHDSSYMYCDSAYFFQQANSLEAFSNVRMEQGDTLFVYGDYLYYDGNTRIAYLRENVRMENGQVTLFTDSLNYDRPADIGYYFEGGLIVDSENELSSYFGQYSPGTKIAIFNDSVRLENPQFTLYSDTLNYDTESKIATILGPSIIVSDSGTIYSSRGWYDTATNTSLLLDRSQVVSNDKILIGDSISYDRDLGLGQAFGNMSLVDTTKHITLAGDYGYYNEKTGYAFATDSACFMEYSKGDTLFLHADTLQMLTVDSTFREIKAYHGVRFYRIDMQGVCDSMQFNTRDSILYMYTQPILWNEQYQLYGDTIEIHMNDSTIEYAHVKQFAFAAQHIDSTYYNQLKGNDLKAYFEGQAIRQIDVAGNAESIFYPLEKDGAKVGLNETKSGFLSIWVKDRKLDKLKIWPSPVANLTPIPDLQPSQKMLKDFYWFDYLRPKSKEDIYEVVKRKVEDAPKRSNKFVP